MQHPPRWVIVGPAHHCVHSDLTSSHGLGGLAGPMHISKPPSGPVIHGPSHHFFYSHQDYDAASSKPYGKLSWTSTVGNMCGGLRVTRSLDGSLPGHMAAAPRPFFPHAAAPIPSPPALDRSQMEIADCSMHARQSLVSPLSWVCPDRCTGEAWCGHLSVFSAKGDARTSCPPH